jgi:low temperature requirement protein LtrA
MSLSHRSTRMTGRDPEERHRSSTPLELLFDLTFVVAFSQISSQAAHYLEEGDVATALAGFAFTTFAVSWAWINYSWLASAYDNDDIFFRIATLVEMLGVLILALGVPPVFDSFAEGEHFDGGVVVAGYVVMRIAAVALWLRAATHDPAHRRTALAYAMNISIAQIGWVILIFLNLPIGMAAAIALTLIAFELAGPLYAELTYGRTPWHPHHIAERYGLLVIITLGEVVLGTILAISAVVESPEGWSLEAILIGLGGTALVFALWWSYFTMPSGTMLARHPGRAWVWGYGHIVLFGSLVGVGAGLHVASQVIAHDAHVDAAFALAWVAIPVLIFEVMLFVLYTFLVRRFDPFHLWLFVGGVALLALSVVAVSAGLSIGGALLIVAASPLVIVVGYETVGYRHQAALLESEPA